MTPFNLEQALAGKPFTNDKGWTVEDWHYFRTTIERPISIKFAELDHTTSWAESDLFMLPEKKKVWIVVYETMEGILSYVFDNLPQAEDFIHGIGDNHLETIEKEYEL